MTIRPTAVAQEELQKQQDEGTLLEAAKAGTLRVGNSGVIDGDKQYGKCARLTHLRFLGGAGEDFDTPRLVMFAGGKANESVWEGLLRRRYPNILMEEAIPVSWTNAQGILVTGRPDMVICDENNVPLHGIELKMVASVWTSRDVRFQHTPKLDHLCQAGHYMMLLGIPYSLCYTQYVEFPVVGWMQKSFPKQGTAGSESCEYNDKGDIKKVVPYMWGYDLRWSPDGDRLEYSLEGQEQWTSTVVSQSGLRAYYNQFQGKEGAYKQVLGPHIRPITADAQGCPNKGWSLCDAAYCPFSDLCNRADAGGWSLGDWSEMAQQLRGTGQPSLKAE